MAWSKAGQFLILLVSMVVGCAMTPDTARAAPPLSAYGNLPGIELAALSQSGERIALIGIVKDERRLIIISKDNKPILTSAPLGDVKVRGLYWAGDDNVLVYKSDTTDLPPLEFAASKAELGSVIVVPLNDKKAWWKVFANRKQTITGGVRDFFGIRARDGKYFGYFSGITLDAADTTGMGPTLERFGWVLQSTQPVLYEVDLQNQETKRIAPRFEGNGRRNWMVGPDGAVSARIDYHSKSGSWTIWNRAGDKIASGTNPLGGIDLVGLGGAPDTLIYAEEDNDDGERHWYELPLTGGAAKAVLEDVGLNEVILDPRSRQFVGYEQEGDTPSYRFFNVEHQKVIDAIMKAFPGLSVHLKDWNDRFDTIIVMTEGVGDPQTWWLINVKTGRAQYLGISYPLQPKDVGTMRMIHYKAGDGTDIAAVLTLPPDVPAKNLPVVVLPHGGPGARDYPGFDWRAQAFASRGYAVLQPNFRGSTGYGVAFEKAGYGEWGRKMQSDISDGLEHLINDGIADPQRACIMGGGYGGYAALAGVTLQKGIYRCAVSVAGVSDLEKWASNLLDERASNATVRRALKHEVGSGKELRAVSPINFAAAADAPILLIHGKDDIVVHYDQSEAMADALRKAGKEVEFVTLPGEDHWLSKSATRLTMLEAAMAFIEKHNPAGLSK